MLEFGESLGAQHVAVPGNRQRCSSPHGLQLRRLSGRMIIRVLYTRRRRIWGVGAGVPGGGGMGRGMCSGVKQQ